MPRGERILVPDVVYHVGSRGVERRPIFDVVPCDRAFFIDLLARTVVKYDWLCHAYCLMGNHFHLLVETPRANLNRGMQYLKGQYARWFNDACSRKGALFECRYFSELALDERHAYELARYIALNPVRAGICSHPRDWAWGSYPSLTGLAKRPAFLNGTLIEDLYGTGPRGIAAFDLAIADGIALTKLERAAA